MLKQVSKVKHAQKIVTAPTKHIFFEELLLVIWEIKPTKSIKYCFKVVCCLIEFWFLSGVPFTCLFPKHICKQYSAHISRILGCLEAKHAKGPLREHYWGVKAF